MTKITEELEKKIEQLERENLEFKFRMIEQKRNNIIQEIKKKYPDMIRIKDIKK